MGKTTGATQLGQVKVTERSTFLGQEWAEVRQILGEGPGKWQIAAQERQEHL
jgi:hypothetical protein